jgi:hypothetical protein
MGRGVETAGLEAILGWQERGLPTWGRRLAELDVGREG